MNKIIPTEKYHFIHDCQRVANLLNLKNYIQLRFFKISYNRTIPKKYSVNFFLKI